MSLADKISAYNRDRKWRLFLEQLEPHAGLSVLDVGFNAEEYSSVDNYIEKHYPYPERITALGLGSPEAFEARYPSVRAVRYDGGTFPFSDKEFDVCWSNAVIEHVGDREQQLAFLREIRRVSRRAFITTPNKRFPIEVHTRTPLLHWLPKPIFERYLHAIGKGWATGRYMNLLSWGEIRRLLADAGIENYRIYRNRLCFLTLDFVITF